MVIPRFVVTITDKCSLRCKECSALIPEFTAREDIKTRTVSRTWKNFLV